MPAAEVDRQIVNVHQHDPPHGLVLENFFQHAAVTAADDQHAGRVRVGEERDVGHHLGVDELITFSELDDAVQHQRMAVKSVPEEQHILIGLNARKKSVHPLP